jgi:LysR family transcriptional regulator of gallate degradation
VALHELGQAASDLAAARGQAGGQVVVGVLPLLPQLLLARTIARLRASYPDAAVDDPRRFARAADGGVAVRRGRHHRRRLAQSAAGGAVVETELFADPYVVVVRRGHALASRKRIGAAELAAYDWVVPQRDMPRRQAVEALFAMLPAARGWRWKPARCR